MKVNEYVLHQGIKKWNLIFTLIFIFIGSLFFYILLKLNKLPTNINLFDLLIFSLAIFRMIRLFVYDNIFLFLRESFMDQEKNGDEINFVPSQKPLKRTLHKLILCPWCMGVWLAMCSVFALQLEPKLYIVFVVLAISSIATFMQILTNLIGWNAEAKKLEAEKLSK